MAMTRKNFQKYVLENGGAEGFLYNGRQSTTAIKFELEFASHSDFAAGSNFYRFELTPTVNETFLVSEERKYVKTQWRSYGPPGQESQLYDERNERSDKSLGNVYESTSGWSTLQPMLGAGECRNLRHSVVRKSSLLVKLIDVSEERFICLTTALLQISKT